MKFEYVQHYAAPPAQVVSLLRNRHFIAALAARADARGHTVETADSEISVTMVLEAPQAAATFFGDTLTVLQRFRFSPADQDGTIAGSVSINVNEAPVDADGSIVLAEEPSGHTTARITGDLHVRVPLLGRQLERDAEPAVAKGLSELEATAADWLK